MVHIDDLVEPRLEQIVLTAIAPLPRPRQITLHRADEGRESRPKPPLNLQDRLFARVYAMQLKDVL
jgi:hypothetical protein